MPNYVTESQLFGPLQLAIARYLQKSCDLSAPIPAEHARLLRRLDPPLGEHLDTSQPELEMLTTERP
jgi:hypothetical protein